MKIPTFFVLAGLCGAGLLSGILARRLTSGRLGLLVNRAAPVVAGGKSTANISLVRASGTQRNLVEIPFQRSSDTLETLAALDEGNRYGRLATWMVDASEQDIAAYWAIYRKGKRSNSITDLIFINWTRLNPHGALAATAGSKDENCAWWAWACHDPNAALVSAIAAGSERVDSVARGIGEFHPNWLREHFNEIPESSRGRAMSGLAKWVDGENPLETLKFFKKNGKNYDAVTFKALAQQDPWAAFDWLQGNPDMKSNHYGSGHNPMEILIETMSIEHPDDLERLAAQTPSGELKRKMEAALFDSLLETDPGAAIERAKTTASSIIAAERFAKIGLSLIKTDPDLAFEMARKQFEVCPNKDSSTLRLEYPNGSSSWGGSDGECTELIDALIAKDPARVMEMTSQLPGKDGQVSQVYSNAAYQWANQDLVSYTSWVNQQTDPAIHEFAAGPVVNELTELGQYPEALEWAMNSDKSKGGNLINVLYQWQVIDPEAASGWLEAADLPAAEKSRLQKNFEEISNQNEE